MATIKDAVFKKKGDVPSSVLKALLVSNVGAAIAEKLAQFKSPTASTPYVTPVITVANSTGRITDSRLVMRGPLFTATKANVVSANQIWHEAREDVRISFLIDESLNISDWVELRALNGYRVTDSTAGRDIQDQELDEMDGLKEGACVRVVLQHKNAAWVSATLQVNIQISTEYPHLTSL